ncbi:hypothetical protein WISP_00400 [Willisornis vidua]|uniref:Alpha-1,3-mannosyl-glycoprotein 2-beta-N-acetylglucosaminyltransferase n=1 Tax=Willisornis vidua TaxID=1566151 RepID=A0ABQ9DYQ0_9PASS|nr:hypothetical protein WISP_00400 [Willisornis vidua]
MPKQSRLALWGVALFLAWNALVLLFLRNRPAPPGTGASRLPSELIRLAQDAEAELERQKELLRQIHRLSGLWEQRRRRKPATAPPPPPRIGTRQPQPATPPPPPPSSEPPALPVLVLACDRSTVRRCLDKLLRYRPSARRFPVIVSQDCGHAETARVIASYGNAVEHIRQPDLSDVAVPPEHRKFQVGARPGWGGFGKVMKEK